MNTYLVECQVPCGDHGIFLVKANNKKEALEKVWNNHYVHENKKAKEKGYDPYYKYDLCVRNIENEILKNEEVAMI